PRRWIKKQTNNKCFSKTGRYIVPRTKYEKNDGEVLDGSKYLEFMVVGDKLDLCGIHNGDIILVTTREYLHSIDDYTQKDICIFSDGNICQVAFEGNIGTDFEEIWRSCRDTKNGKALLNKKKRDLKDYLTSWSSDKPNVDNIVIAFKYPVNKSGKNIKEWHVYQTSDIVGVLVYKCNGRING
ncbi:MAG: hypothetical protein J6Y37_02410, partial [Paludibacteraceae bacterium]|nr:hypothetical protein [Paludibacteraceae bacterium]